MRVLHVFAVPMVLCFAAGAAAADPSLSMTLDGKPWTAENVSASETVIAGKPVLNIAGTNLKDGQPVVFSTNLAIAAPGQYAGTYAYPEKSDPTGNTASFSDPTRGDDFMEQRFRMTGGQITVTSDAAAHTVSGTFAMTGISQSKKTKLSIENGVFKDIPVVTP
ncbi:DUF6252 family protein [Aestuariivirga sp.]|uniref:DUF6252 family protein n=1 Tax=Aestuariivirga sp. TaxID=2650926 RepID=UPI0039E4FF84